MNHIKIKRITYILYGISILILIFNIIINIKKDPTASLLASAALIWCLSSLSNFNTAVKSQDLNKKILDGWGEIIDTFQNHISNMKEHSEKVDEIITSANQLVQEKD